MKPFWEPFDVEVGSRWTRRVGFSELSVEHDEKEWKIASVPTRDSPPPAGLRIATNTKSNRIALTPRLADRAVVARLEVPVLIAPGDQTTIYVGSPLWISVALDPPEGQPAGEIRLFDPPNTWFGPNTRSGELCYASRTSGLLRAGDIDHQENRATTTVVIENLSEFPLTFERVRIPVPSLALFVAPEKTLWTNRVFVRHQHAASPPTTDEVEDGPPQALELGEFIEVAAPREVYQPNLLARAFGVLL